MVVGEGGWKLSGWNATEARSQWRRVDVQFGKSCCVVLGRCCVCSLDLECWSVGRLRGWLFLKLCDVLLLCLVSFGVILCSIAYCIVVCCIVFYRLVFSCIVLNTYYYYYYYYLYFHFRQ